MLIQDLKKKKIEGSKLQILRHIFRKFSDISVNNNALGQTYK